MKQHERRRNRRGDYWTAFIISGAILYFLAYVWAEYMANNGHYNLSPSSTFWETLALASLPMAFPGLAVAHLIGAWEANRDQG